MYYRKYFEGTVEASTAETVYLELLNKQGLSSSSMATCNSKRNKVIGEALESTLKDCGLTGAKYENSGSFLYFDYNNSDFGVYVSCESNNVYIYAGYYSNKYSDSIIKKATQNGHCTYVSYSSAPFEQTSYLVASNYKFYVTVRGDTAGMFTVYIGSYSSPTYMSGLRFTIFRGKDKRTNKAVWGYIIGSEPSTSIYWVHADTIKGVLEYSSSPYYPSPLTVASRLTMVDQWVVLIEQYMTNAGFIVIDNVYLDPGYNSSGGFYEIDSNIYYCYTPFLVKCITPVTTE